MWRRSVLIFGIVALLGGELSAQTDASEPAQLHRNVPDTFYPGDPPPGPPITFRVVTEDGAALSSPPQILVDRTSDERCRVENTFLSGTVMMRLPQPLTGYMEQKQTRCRIAKLIVPGYRTFSGWVGEGTVVKLYRLGEHEGVEVSFKSLSAPPAARKEYDRGEAAMNKSKWADAQKRFERAVAVYPDYSTAWSELGTALERQGRLAEAEAALGKARAADPRYIKPVVQLAGLADEQQKWADELRIAGDAVTMHPVNFPRAFYYYARACYQLGRYEPAVHAIHAAIEVDTGLEVPEAHFLAGLILDKLDRGAEAAAEFQRYLDQVPHGPHADEAKARIGQPKQPASGS